MVLTMGSIHFTVSFKGVQAVINYYVHAALQCRLRPEVTYGGTVELVAIEGFDAIFFPQNVMIDVRAINECARNSSRHPRRDAPGVPFTPMLEASFGLFVPKPSSKIRSGWSRKFAEEH